MVLAEKTRQFEQGPHGQIGHEDRAQKRLELEKQLFPGIVCEGLFSHADHTENCFREMLQPGINRFWHIPLHECITADQELALGKDFWSKNKKITVDAEGLWRQEKEVQLPKLTFPDAMHIRAALNRRSMAAHCAGVCQYEEHELITTWLMTRKLREVLTRNSKTA